MRYPLKFRVTWTMLLVFLFGGCASTGTMAQQATQAAPVITALSSVATVEGIQYGVQKAQQPAVAKEAVVVAGIVKAVAATQPNLSAVQTLADQQIAKLGTPDVPLLTMLANSAIGLAQAKLASLQTILPASEADKALAAQILIGAVCDGVTGGATVFLTPQTTP